LLKVLLLLVRYLRRLVVVVIKKELYRVNSAIVTVARLGITLVRIRKMQQKILNLM
jgi:hypothetical protein